MATTAETIFQIDTSSYAYVSDTGAIITFGLDSAHSDYAIPCVVFDFYDPYGQPLAGNAPSIYMRLGGAFNSVLSNSWSDASNIMGSPAQGTSIFEGPVGQALGRLGDSAVAGLQRQIVAGIAGSTGYLASAGQTGRAQIEFLTRKFLNNFQQVVYQGPRFRAFNLPFSLKPTNYSEAISVRNIIHNFRLASAPKAEGMDWEKTIANFRNGSSDGTLANSTQPNPNDPKYKDSGGKDSEEYKADLAAWQKNFSEFWTEEEIAALSKQMSGYTFLFGYPDLIKFRLMIYSPEKGTFLNNEALFESDYCAIETVTVDYGAQAKMTFFDSDATGGFFIPSETALTLSLKETTLITAGAQYTDWAAGHTMF